jgi:hypothetical protein
MTDEDSIPEETLRLGGAISMKGRRGHITRIHVAPMYDACSVQPLGCGYCIGVPCKEPKNPEPEQE